MPSTFNPSSLTDDELTFMFSASLPLIRLGQGKSSQDVGAAVEIAKGALEVLNQTPGALSAYIDKLEAFSRGDSGQAEDRRTAEDPSDGEVGGSKVPHGV